MSTSKENNTSVEFTVLSGATPDELDITADLSVTSPWKLSESKYDMRAYSQYGSHVVVVFVDENYHMFASKYKDDFAPALMSWSHNWSGNVGAWQYLETADLSVGIFAPISEYTDFSQKVKVSNGGADHLGTTVWMGGRPTNLVSNDTYDRYGCYVGVTGLLYWSYIDIARFYNLADTCEDASLTSLEKINPATGNEYLFDAYDFCQEIMDYVNYCLGADVYTFLQYTYDFKAERWIIVKQGDSYVGELQHEIQNEMIDDIEVEFHDKDGNVVEDETGQPLIDIEATAGLKKEFLIVKGDD